MASTGDTWRRIVVVALLAGSVAAATVAAALPTTPEIDCASFEREATIGSGLTIRVVGDSYTQGFGVEPDEAWPAYLERRLVIDGFGGSGFVASPCPHETFAERVDGVGTLVVIQGGLNDWLTSSPEVARGVRRAIAAADAPVVIVGPPAAPAREVGARRVDRLLARVAAAGGVQYVSTIGLDLPYLADQLHLTAAGHRKFGRYVARQIGALG